VRAPMGGHRKRLLNVNSRMTGKSSFKSKWGGSPMKRTLSIAVGTTKGSNNEYVWMALNERELNEVDQVLETTEGSYAVDELRRLYAHYKFNRKKINRADFQNIFAMYCWCGEACGLADTAFDMAAQGTPSMSFPMLVRFLLIMTKQKRADKAIFCFNLFDGAMDSPWTEQLDPEQVAKIIAQYPLRVFQRRDTNLNMLTKPEDDWQQFTQLGVIEEEEERAGDDSLDHTARQRRESVGGTTLISGAAVNFQKQLDENTPEQRLRMAKEIVKMAYDELGHDITKDKLSVQDFHMMVKSCTVAEYFVPLWTIKP